MVFLSAIGLVLLLLPRFTPRAPRWAERFVPPRYRRRRAEAETEAAEAAVVADEAAEERVPVAAGVSRRQWGHRHRTPFAHKVRI